MSAPVCKVWRVHSLRVGGINPIRVYDPMRVYAWVACAGDDTAAATAFSARGTKDYTAATAASWLGVVSLSLNSRGAISGGRGEAAASGATAHMKELRRVVSPPVSSRIPARTAVMCNVAAGVLESRSSLASALQRFQAALGSGTNVRCHLRDWLVERLVATCRSLTAVVRAQVTVGSLVAMYNAALCLDKLTQSRAAREVLEHVASEIASCPAAGVRCIVLWDLAVFLTSESVCSCARAGPRIICGMGPGLCFSGRATVERGVGAAASHARRNTVHGRTIFRRMRAPVAVGHAAQACTTEVVTATSHTPSAACPGVAAVW